MTLPYRVPEANAGSCYRHGLDVLVAYLPVLLVLGVVVAALTAAGTSLTRQDGMLGLVGMAFGSFIALPARWGYYAVCLQGVRGRAASEDDLARVRDHYAAIVVAGVLVTLMVIAGLVLLVVPGIWVYCRTRFVPYLVVRESLGAVEAISESFRLTRGLTGTILGITALGLAASFVGLLMLGLGLLPALIWWDLALASLYHAVIVSPEEAEIEDLRDLFAQTA